LFFSKLKENKKFASPDLLSKDLKSRDHEGAFCFDKSGKVIYFTRVVENAHTAIFTATYEGSDWTNVTLLPFNLNNYNFKHPCLSSDGKRLFFSSNRPGGQGGHDIWVSTMGRSGWGPVKNLGATINSDSSEFYPFLHQNGKLYFVSTRKQGSAGGADIFWSMEINGQWLPAQPLPAPFNTKYDDYSYISDSTDRKGYISSTRNKSADLFSFVKNIPTFENPKPIQKNTYRYKFNEMSVGMDSSTFLYEWDFGDNTKFRGRLLEIRHIFPGPGDYLVQLNVIDSLTGVVALNQASNIFKVRDKEQPVITCLDSIIVQQEISFDADKSYLPNYPSAEFYWDFGDGTILKGNNLKHAYYFPGKYRVMLAASSKGKNQESANVICVYKDIEVFGRKTN
jgi:hypothetical protein